MDPRRHAIITTRNGLLLGLMGLVVSGCQHGTSIDPAADQHAPSYSSVVPLSFHPGDSIPALFELTIDPATITASAQPVASRGATGYQASMYDLDLHKFQTPTQFKPESVRFNLVGDVEVAFTHAHPFPAPDLTQPPIGINRADLGYTGRALILADLPSGQVASHTFFGDVIANTDLVRGADGYVQPGDLLFDSGFNTNCFPYMLLADEAKDNRVGVSNG
ncbi:MAG: hypothetical protein ABI743_10760, partial [bacterium]